MPVTTSVINRISIGFMLRSGFERKMLRMAVECTINGPTESHPKNNYSGIKIGFLIGRKRDL